MSVIASISDLLNLLSGGNNGTPEDIWVWKDHRIAGAAAAAPIAGRMHSFWLFEGTPPHGAAPGAVSNPDNSTSGGLRQTDPGGGRQKYITGYQGGVQGAGTFILYDRLLHISGLSGTNATAQTVGGSLTRYTDGAGNQIWVEIYTQIGASSTTVSASYTNTVPTAGRTTLSTSIGNTGFREQARIIPLTLQSGDLGVTSVQSVTLAATTGTAGDFGVTIAHPLQTIPCTLAILANVRDNVSQLPPLTEIKTDACLALAFLPNAATNTQFIASFHFVEK